MPGKLTGKHQDKRLSAAFVRSTTQPGRYMDGQGLFLKVDATGAKRWGQRLLIRGKRHDIGLGGVELVPLALARALALENRALARTGGDPLAAKRLAERIPTFAQAVDKYLETKLAEFRSTKHAKQWRATLDTYAGPLIGQMRVSDIEMRDVLRVLKPIWETKTETASRLRGRIEAVLSWATVCSYRTGDNPARWRGNLDLLLPKPSKVAKSDNQPALALSDVPQWWSNLQTRDGMAAQALQFLTLTLARSGEVRGMTWDEVDLERALWIIPVDRMKAGREHRVPLTKEAVTLLRNLPQMKGSPFVFFAPRGGMLSDMTISSVMRRMQEAEEKAGRSGYLDSRNKRPAVPHGLRSTFRDWAAEQGFERDLAEMALAHNVGSEVERAYRRTDLVERRRAMMGAWGRVLRGETGAQVVQFAG
ncbi:MAG: tyrosine-type recombinase/integrase [Albidovulum sp.]|uniref:tyrosine-type recombinase/integrase n=1 Tax=Albidovulum sp. TaxID=1872424 RepID=UPI003C84E245